MGIGEFDGLRFLTGGEGIKPGRQENAMGELFIGNLDDAILTQLKRRAWERGLPLEEYLRRLIISDARIDGEPAPSNIALPPRPPHRDVDGPRPIVLHS
jgi:hypothetical protein